MTALLLWSGADISAADQVIETKTYATTTTTTTTYNYYLLLTTTTTTTTTTTSNEKLTICFHSLYLKIQVLVPEDIRKLLDKTKEVQ